MTTGKSDNGYNRGLAVIVIACSLLLFSSAFVSATEIGGFFIPKDTTARYDRLFKKAHSEGKVRVIVGLRTSSAPEGRATDPEIMASQRLRISRAQESLLGSVHISDESSIGRFRHIPFMALGLDEAALRNVMSNPLVSSIEEDMLYRPILLQYTSSLIGVGSGEAGQYTGAGQTIVILDTGVDKTHPFLNGKIVDEACFSTKDLNYGVVSLCPSGQISQTGSGAGVYCPAAFSDCYHGTHVAGIAAGKKLAFQDGTLRGVAPDSDIISIQVYSAIFDASTCSDMGVPSPCVLSYSSDILRALDYVHYLRNIYNIASVNISAGGDNYTANCDYVSPSFAAAIAHLRSSGIATVVAAGNEAYPDGLSVPACISTAVSVGATEYYGNNGLPEQVAPYSNSSPFLSLLAPGGCSDIDNLTSCGILSSIPIEWGSYWAYSAGTSSAAPHVAGAWALLKQKKPSASVDEILATLQWTGKSYSDPKNGVIKPRIQVDAALAALSSNNCVAILSDNFLLHNPIIIYNGHSYQADFQYALEGLDFALTAAGFVADTIPYSSCVPSTLSYDYKLHMPEVIYDGISYWADFNYTGGTTFTLTGAGKN